MTDKLRQAAEMALEALNSKYIVNCGAWMIQQDRAAGALRQALTEPPKREWVGLTDEELPKGATHEFDRGVRWAEAKLKERNS